MTTRIRIAGLVGVVACSGFLASTSPACGGTVDDPSVDDSALSFPDDDTFTCAGSPSGEPPPMLSNLIPASPVDYVELRDIEFPRPVPSSQLPLPRRDAGIRDASSVDASVDASFDFDASADANDAGSSRDAGAPTTTTTTTTSIHQSSGQACSGATDRDGCLAKLRDARVAPEQGWPTFFVITGPVPSNPSTRFLVFTRGDEVGVVRSAGELTSFLGPAIDSAEEARLILSTRMTEILSCAIDERSPNHRSGWRRNDDGSWEVIIARYECATKSRSRYRIAPNGEVTFVTRKVLKLDSQC